MHVSMKSALRASAASVSMSSLQPGVVFAAAAPGGVEALQERQQELHDASQAIIQAADDAGGDLSETDLEAIETNRVEMEKIGRQISARQAVAPQAAAGTGRKTAAEPRDPSGSRGVAAAARSHSGKGPYNSFGEFCIDIRSHATSGSMPDRLRAAATTFGGEGTGTDGGFAVPPDFRKDIWVKTMAEENLLMRCAQLVTGSNNIVIPKDETTPWDTSNGIQVYWEAEAASVTQSKPQLSMSSIRLAKLMALVPVSDELLEDAPGLESWLRAKAPAKMAAKINTAIISGTGVGQPLGILTAATTGSVVSVAKESSQASATLLFANIQKMWARLYAPCRRNAIWLINQDTEPQLNGMAFDPAATSKVPAYLPANGLSVEPYATLMGRPVVPLEACSTIGTQGDIILVDLQQYWAVTRGNDVRTDVSMHLFFDQGLQAFRFTFRLNGQPAWGTSITPQNGSLTRSWAVTLDAR
jgi:HK97 family phage major capsid protein